MEEIRIPHPQGGPDLSVQVHEKTSEQFAMRLRKVARERRKWAKRENITCYRIYDADVPEYAVAIDLYEGAGDSTGETFVHVAEYKPPSTVDEERARMRLEDALTIVCAVLGVPADNVFLKERRRAKGGSQYTGTAPSRIAHVQEGPCLLEVDLAAHLDTGLFLDHRPIRLRIGSLSADKRFLNLFAYTGTASVHAALGGAVRTTTVDLSGPYLEWAGRNMALNGMDGPEHRRVRGDVMRWLASDDAKKDRYDLIFVDPPTFSNSKSMGKRTWDVQRDHVELLALATDLLSEEGFGFFSCNLRSFEPDREGLARRGVSITDMTAETIPHDFERNPKIHYCFRFQRA